MAKGIKEVIGKFYVDAIRVQGNIIQLQIVFFYSQNPWLNPNDQMLGQVQVRSVQNGVQKSTRDYTLTILLPIAQIDTSNQDYKQLLDYVCETFTQCVNQNVAIVC